MATELATAYISLVPSMRGVQGEIAKQFQPIEAEADRTGQRAGGRFKASFGKVAAGLGALFAGQKVFGFLQDSVGEAREAQKVGKITEQIIKSTGGAAQITAAQVGDLAAALSAKAGVDDEAIQTGANLLLTFKNVRNEVGKGNDIFNQATAAAVDLSATGFGSIDSSSKMLGKALNDPLKGITALSRAGVTFTEQQKSQIKTLVESGKTLDAQKMILKEVQSQVGGVAASSATAGEKASVAWGNVKEQLGGLLLPVIDRVATALYSKIIPAISTFISQMQSGKGPGGAFADALGSVRDVVSDVAGVLRDTFGPVIEKVTGFMRDNPTVVKTFAVALGVLAVAIGGVTIATTAFSIALNSTGIPLLIIGIAALVAGLIYAYQHSSKFREIVQQVGAVVQQFAAFIRDQVAPVIVDLAQKVASNLQPVWAALADFFTGSVLPVVQQLIAKFQQWQPTIQRVIGVVASLVAKWVDFYTSVLGKVLPVVIRFAGFLLRNLVPAVANVIGVIVRVVAKVIDFGGALLDGAKKVGEFAAKVKDKIGKVVGWFTSLPGKVTGALGDVGSLLLDAGKKIIGGLFNGLKEKWKEVSGWVSSRAQWIKDHKGPPSKDAKLLVKAGQLIMGGLNAGLRSGFDQVEDTISKITDRLSTFIDKKKVGKKVAKQMQRVAAQVGSAASALGNLLSQQADLAGSVASNLVGEFNLSDIFAKNQFGLSAGGDAAVQVAQSLVARMQAFAQKLGALAAAGLPPALLREVAGYGSVEGTRVADALLTSGLTAQIGASYNAFDAATRSAGAVVGNATYGGDIAQAEQNLTSAIERGLGKMGLQVNVGIGKETSLQIVQVGTKQKKKRK